MEDSDDYFVDDIVLDESILSILDGDEHSGNLSQSFPSNPRPTKRQKTEHASRRPIQNNRDFVDDFEDMPEISLRDDGSYGLRGSQGLTALVEANAAVGRIESSAARSVGSHTVATQGSAQNNAARRFSVAPRPSQSGSSARFALICAALDPSLSQAPSGSQDRAGSRRPSQPQRRASSTITARTGPTEQNLQRELDLLHSQVEELRQATLNAEKAAKDAQDARFAREGEVSILRKGIEKTAQEHAANIAKLKLAKEAAEAAQAQIQKDLKEEMERLRTQFIFKQHEVETSLRKAPGTVRASKISREVPVTPLEMPSLRLPHSTARKSQAAASTSFIHNAPSQPQFGAVAKGPSKFSRSQKPARTETPRTPKKAMPLPGFHNSFLPSSATQGRKSKVKDRDPQGQTQDIKGKGKGKGKQSPALFDFHSQAVHDIGPIPSPPSSPTPHAQDGIDNDFVMYDVDDHLAADMGVEEVHLGSDLEPMELAEDLLGEELDGIDPPDWRSELWRIIFSHTSPPSNSLTLQMLLGARLPEGTPAAEVDEYSAACSSILELLGSSSNRDWESIVSAVSDALAMLACILNTGNLILHLAGLLNLLMMLSFSLPSFTSSLLSSSLEKEPNPDRSPRLVDGLCGIIRDHLGPSKVASGGDHQILAKETIGLLEALCWNISKESERQLAEIPRRAGILSILIDDSQPLWFLCRSTRFLVLLASRASLFQHLLSFSDSEMPADNKDVIPHVERLSSYLTDATRQGTDDNAMKINVLTFIAMLSIAHNDALTMLLESRSIIPSLVVFLTNLTIPLWEDDPDVAETDIDVASRVRTISQTLCLLHHLVSSRALSYNLRHKLHHAPHRQFNGIIHMFIVTFGRLSYADPPEWMNRDVKIELEEMADVARDLLDLVVEGPEADSVWAAYQGQEDGSDTDDDEKEARMLEANSIE